jgi:two-component system, NarL family, response regulator DegU
MKKIKILLADDHQSFRRIVVSFLKMHKTVESVDEAFDGEDVIQKAEKLHPDLIFMDIHMPGQNGIEAAKVIKSRWPSIKVFILSTDINEYYKKNTQEIADGFIIKSSMKNELVSILSGEHRSMEKMPEIKEFAA